MIEEHLTFGQLEDYAAKLLPAEEIPAFHRHAEVCSACREMLIASLTGTEHLAEQQAVTMWPDRWPSKKKTGSRYIWNRAPPARRWWPIWRVSPER